jgi:DNA-binding NtrC family response regulator
MESHHYEHTLYECEREHILEIVARCEGNRTHAAKILDISIRGLRDKLRCYAQQGFPVPAARGSDRMPDDRAGIVSG